MKYQKIFGQSIKLGTLLCTWGLIGTVILQIFSRFFLENTPPWTEEASRLFFMYSVAFASGLAMKNDYYVHLDMFYERFGPKVKKALNLAIPIVVFLLFVIIAIYGVKFVFMGMSEKSPSMGFNMGIVFFSMPIMALSICFYLWEKIIRTIKGPKP